MSDRPIYQFVLSGLLAVVVASTSKAQITVPVVPPPPFCAFDGQSAVDDPPVRTVEFRINSEEGVSGNFIINERNFNLLIWPVPECFEFERTPVKFTSPVETEGLTGFFRLREDRPETTGPRATPVCFGHFGAEEGLRHWVQQKYPFPIKGLASLHWNEHGGWWVEKARMPTQQYIVAPGHAEPQAVPPSESHGCCNMPLPPPCCSKANSPNGTWVSELDGTAIALTFAGDDLKICLFQILEGATLCFTFSTHHTMTPDGLVHGAITGAAVETKRLSRASGLPPEVEPVDPRLSDGLQCLIDCPFSFRTKMTPLGLMISNLKLAGTSVSLAPNSPGLFSHFGGMYKLSKEGALPVPKERTDVPNSALPTLPPPRECSAAGRAEPSTEQLDKRQIFNFSFRFFDPMNGLRISDPAIETASPITSPAPTVQFPPPPPLSGPPQTFDRVVNVLGQMTNGSQPPAVAVVPPPPVPCPMHQACPMPLTGVVLPPCAALPMPKLGPVGTWVRVVGPMVYVLQIAPDHLTITATASYEGEDGKVETDAVILTGEYHLMRDGTTMVGLITSVDARLEGELPTSVDFAGITEQLSELQKAVTDKPFAMSVRLHGDALVIGNVRLPEVESLTCWYPMTILGGRYTAAGDKPLPKPRVAKASLPMPVMPVCLPAKNIMPSYAPGCSPISPAGVMSAPSTIPMLPRKQSVPEGGPKPAYPESLQKPAPPVVPVQIEPGR